MYAQEAPQGQAHQSELAEVMHDGESCIIEELNHFKCRLGEHGVSLMWIVQAPQAPDGLIKKPAENLLLKCRDKWDGGPQGVQRAFETC